MIDIYTGINLRMFDGADGGATGGDGASNTVTLGQAFAAMSGQQAGQAQSPAATEGQTATEPTQAMDADAEWAALIGKDGRLRAQYERATQDAINRRMRGATKELNAYKGLAKALSWKYGTEDPNELSSMVADDDYMLQAEADAEGLTVEQMRHAKRIQTELDNARAQQELDRRTIQLMQWQAEAAQSMADIPGFDLVRELDENQQFRAIVEAGVNIRQAYDVCYPEMRDAAVSARAAAAAQKATVDNIRARGMRPAENPQMAMQGGVNATMNPSTMTGEQIKAAVDFLKKNPGMSIRP